MAEKPTTAPPAPAPKLGRGSDAMKALGAGLKAVTMPTKLVKVLGNPLAAPKIILEIAPGGSSLPGVMAAATLMEKAGGLIKSPLSGAAKLGMDSAMGNGDPVGAGLDQAAKAGSAAIGAGLKGLGQGADMAGAAADMAAQGAGNAVSGAGKALSGTVIGAIIGVPLIVVGTGIKAGGKVAKVAGKAAKAVSKVAAAIAKTLIKVLGKLAKLGYKVAKITVRTSGKALKVVNRTKRTLKRVAKPLRAVRRFAKRVQAVKKKVKKVWNLATAPVRAVKRGVRIIKTPVQAANSAFQTVNQAAEGTRLAGKGDAKGATRSFKASWGHLKATGKLTKASVTNLKPSGSGKTSDAIRSLGKGSRKGPGGSLLRQVTRPIRLVRASVYKITRPVRVLKRKLEPFRKAKHRLTKAFKIGAAPVKLTYRAAKGLGQHAVQVGKGVHAISDGQMVAGKGDLGKATGHAFQGVRQVVARPNLGIRRTYAETKNAAQAKFKRGRSLGGSMESARRSADARKMATPTGQGPTQVHHRMASAYRSGLGGPGGLSRQILRQRPDGLTRRPAQPEGAPAGPQKAIQKRLLDLRSGETLRTRQGYQHPFSTAPRASSPAPAAPEAPVSPLGAPQAPSPAPAATSAPKLTFREFMDDLSKRDPALAGDLARGAAETMRGSDPALQESIQGLLAPSKTSLKPNVPTPPQGAPRAPRPAPAATSAPAPEVKAVEDLLRPVKTSLNAGEIQHLLSNRYQ